ncbi:nucleotidyltransferase domain-containing protein [Haloarchaeobius sp. DT45]|uniref:nucleotidyltransferase domain-containing protein n=1 Tax=Haloarchaeobius sp. DT45 TaxID=3446116 RepID=UPI003F6D86F9
MTIDSTTLDSWASYESGAIQSAQTTHQRIRNVLNRGRFLNSGDFDDFLQGSYRNYTIVRGSSDVDIVAKLTSSYRADLSGLSASEKQQWQNQRTGVTYSWQEFRTDVVDALEDKYGSGAIKEGNKAVEVDTSALRLNADVLVCQQYRKYYSYPTGYYEGVVFWDTSGNQVVNYPKRHIDRGSSKESDTDGRFKETVRMFKRARNYLVKRGELDKETVASYFLENLLYNVPDGRYTYDKRERFEKILSYLQATDYSGWECQNGVTNLFGNGDTKWNTRHADNFVYKLTDLWQSW